jgi:hypothetical protein
MGAANFVTYQPGIADPAAAFDAAVASAKTAYGAHGGDSGTIAEKKSFIVSVTAGPVSEAEAMELAKHLTATLPGGKYGPCGAIPVDDVDGPGWVFFGTAPI